MKYALVLTLMLIVPAAATAQAAGAPTVVEAGLDAYAASGVDAALDVWLEGWAPGDADVARPQLRSLFVRLDEQAGPMIGHEVVGVAPWGARTRRVYVVMLYTTQPVYARFDVYRPVDEWKVVNLTVNTDPAQILPASMFTSTR